ncbi:MAG: branched-chain amino acid ABC transporter permease [Actinomycetota bacterium]|nr:branched-chain amino acid ABC transporter permease [Actinomycetota bacterium]
MLVTYAIIAGLLLGIFYGMMSMGLNVVFGIQRIINLAHGSMVMLGGFGAWELYYALHINPIAAVFIMIPVTVVIGFPLYYLLIPRLKRSQDYETLSLVLFFGLAEVIQALATIIFGNNQRNLPITSIPSHPVHILGQDYQASWLVAAGVALPIMALFLYYLYWTSLGRQTRAVMADEREAAIVGINTRRVSALAFGIGLALAVASGGMAIFILGGVSPADGASVTITAFAIIVLGSLGNPIGAVIGGILFGIANQLAQVYATSWSAMVPYVLVLAVMLLRPQGILGKRSRVV